MVPRHHGLGLGDVYLSRRSIGRDLAPDAPLRRGGGIGGAGAVIDCPIHEGGAGIKLKARVIQVVLYRLRRPVHEGLAEERQGGPEPGLDGVEGGRLSDVQHPLQDIEVRRVGGGLPLATHLDLGAEAELAEFRSPLQQVGDSVDVGDEVVLGAAEDIQVQGDGTVGVDSLEEVATMPEKALAPQRNSALRGRGRKSIMPHHIVRGIVQLERCIIVEEVICPRHYCALTCSEPTVRTPRALAITWPSSMRTIGPPPTVPPIADASF